MVQPAIHGLPIEQIAVIVAVDRRPEIRLDHVEEQVEVDEALGVGIDLDLEPRESQPRPHPFQIELHFHERKPAGIPRQRELSNQASISIILMLIRIEQGALDPAQRRCGPAGRPRRKCAAAGN